MNKMKKKKGYFSISAVAEMFSVHQQTVRLYEREGLISPRRSEGNTRLFSEEDVERLEEIIYLTHKLGINLAGVDMILKQQKRIDRLQKEINSMFKKLQREIETEKENTQNDLSSATQRLMLLKKSKKEIHQTPLLTNNKIKDLHD
ncbi:MAG: Transcriptional regulator (MerR family) [candidate division TM6 bacterium GW2011_GWE2_42_60]|nr:MAG: Transcriptional regulator (MerR family) [candidate division TM6 bacterium GW2011_GWE2_42_60]HBY06143.1 MerR family transcriptional regulator [Candidatus Dependentiae bacterium]